MPTVRFLLVFCLAGATAPAQAADAKQLVEQLANDATRSAARERLLALGASAAGPLVARIDTAPGDHACACLEVLTELGPAGGAAVPALIELARNSQIPPEVQLALVGTLAELIPHRGKDVEITEDHPWMSTLRTLAMDREGSVRTHRERLRERMRFPRGLDLDALLAAAAGRRALEVEVAIEMLGTLGPAAARAVPLLRAVLDRPEPRHLQTDDCVPLHRKAAKALLAIAPDSPEAVAVRGVLAGTWSPPAAAEPAVPERARRRIEELLAELDAADPARRQAAADNLVALGGIAVGPVAALLDSPAAGQAINGALDVLRRLGKHGAPAVPALAEALTRLPADHTIGVVRALAATVPWSKDQFRRPICSGSAGSLKIGDHQIAGTIDVPFLNAFQEAMQELQVAVAIPVDGSPELLRGFLTGSSVAHRRRALEVIAARGAECVALLDTLAPMLTASQPPEHGMEWVNAQSMRTTKVDRSDVIQRLAATAIVAVAPAGHALVATARERLAQLEPK